MTAAAAARIGARVIRNERQCGPARARNLGVREAGGDIVFFTDADVLLHRQAIGEAVGALTADPGIAAVFGSYDDRPDHASFTSQYRNLFHHWVHQTSAPEASTFWTGCGAMRREVFLEMGGFSQEFQRPSIEDIELGSRLRRTGHRIRLLKNMQGTHMKNWRFWNMVQTDIFRRGVPWMQLVLDEGKLGTDLNLNHKSRLATLFAGLLAAVLIALPVAGHGAAILPALLFILSAAGCSGLSAHGQGNGLPARLAVLLAGLIPLAAYWWIDDVLALVPLALIIAITTTHMAFYRYIAMKRNMAFAVAAIPMQVVFFLCCAIAIPIALARHHLHKADRAKRR
jgi:GT2 family glycosyltransferase